MPRGDRRPGPKPPSKLEVGQTWWRNNSMVDGAERAAQIVTLSFDAQYVTYRYLCDRRCPAGRHRHYPATVTASRFLQTFHTVAFV